MTTVIRTTDWHGVYPQRDDESCVNDALTQLLGRDPQLDGGIPVGDLPAIARRWGLRYEQGAVELVDGEPLVVVYSVNPLASIWHAAFTVKAGVFRCWLDKNDVLLHGVFRHGAHQLQPSRSFGAFKEQTTPPQTQPAAPQVRVASSGEELPITIRRASDRRTVAIPEQADQAVDTAPAVHEQVTVERRVILVEEHHCLPDGTVVRAVPGSALVHAPPSARREQRRSTVIDVEGEEDRSPQQRKAQPQLPARVAAPVEHSAQRRRGGPSIGMLIIIAILLSGALGALHTMPTTATQAGLGESGSAPATTPAPPAPAPPVPTASHDPWQYNQPPTIGVQTYHDILCNAGSPLCAEGPELSYDVLVQAGIDPVFQLAHMAHETGFGTAGVGRTPEQGGGRNAHGVKCNEWDHAFGAICSTPGAPGVGDFSTYPTYHDSVAAWAALINGRTYIGAGRITIEEIVPVYAPHGVDGNDSFAYIQALKDDITQWRAQSAANNPPPAPPVAPPAAQTGALFALAINQVQASGPAQLRVTGTIRNLSPHGQDLAGQDLSFRSAGGMAWQLQINDEPATPGGVIHLEPGGVFAFDLLVDVPVGTPLQLVLQRGDEPPISVEVRS